MFDSVGLCISCTTTLCKPMLCYFYEELVYQNLVVSRMGSYIKILLDNFFYVENLLLCDQCLQLCLIRPNSVHKFDSIHCNWFYGNSKKKIYRAFIFVFHTYSGWVYYLHSSPALVVGKASNQELASSTATTWLGKHPYRLCKMPYYWVRYDFADKLIICYRVCRL